MKAIILAAGYGTRLQKSAKGTQYEEYIDDKPKGLLEIKGEPLVTHLVEKINPYVDEIRVMSNDRYFSKFQNWQNFLPEGQRNKIVLLNDGSTRNENRKGSVRDLAIAAGYTEELDIEPIKEPTIVLVSDRYANFSFDEFINFYKEKQATVSLGYQLDEKLYGKAKQHGQIKVDDSERLIEFAEKVDPPISTLISVAFYIFTKEAFELLKEYIAGDEIKDSPGNFLAYIYSKAPVYIHTVNKDPYDIGDLDSYLKAKDN